MNVNRFTASYDSECGICGDQIFTDDQAGYVDDFVACSDCCDEKESEFDL